MSTSIEAVREPRHRVSAYLVPIGTSIQCGNPRSDLATAAKIKPSHQLHKERNPTRILGGQDISVDMDDSEDEGPNMYKQCP